MLWRCVRCASSHPPTDAGDPVTRAFLLGNGYALAGGVGVWNSALDGEFVFKTLLAPNDADLHLVNITDPFTEPHSNVGEALRVLGAAQTTPQGRARLALPVVEQ